MLVHLFIEIDRHQFMEKLNYNIYSKLKLFLVFILLGFFSLVANASNGVQSVNSFVEEKHNATNFNSRQNSSSGQRSSSGYDFIVTVERQNVSNAGTITLDINDDGVRNQSVNTANTPINSYLVYLNDNHSKSDRQNKIGQIVFSNEIYGIEYGNTGTIALSNVSKAGATYPTSTGGRGMESFVFYANNTSSSTRNGDWVSIGSDAKTLRIGAKNGNKGDYIRVITAATPQITVDFNTTSSSGAESTSSKVIRVDLSSASSSNVTVNVAVTGTATGSGTDYTLANFTKTINAGYGVDSATANITIGSIINDALDEANETVILTLSSPNGASLGSDLVHTYTITDNDATPTLSINDVAITEAAANATFTVTLSAAAGRDVTVNYATSNATATAGADYTATSGTATISAGSTSTTFTVGVLADSLTESNETVTLTLSSPANATISDATSTLTITDDDSSVSLSINNRSFTEAAANATFTVTLSAVAGQDVTVGYATSNDTGTAGDDYTATSGTATISAGSTSTTFTVGVLADSLDEANETVTLILSGANNATISDATGVLTIVDDDALPIVDYVLTSSNGAESLSSAILAVDLSTASGREVTVNYSVTGGTATGSGTDFSLSSGTLTFSAGTTLKNITITSIVDDSIEESNETIIVKLASPSNSTLGTTRSHNSEHTYTIRDNDDSTNPLLTATSPLDGAVDVSVTANIVLTFNEEVDVETGYIYIKKIDDDTVVATIDVTSNLVTGSGTKVITINPSNPLLNSTEYYLVIQTTAFDDLSGNSYAGFDDKTTLNFTTINDSIDPTVAITALEVVDGDVSGHSSLSVTFTLSEVATDFVVGDVTLVNGALTNFTGSGMVYTATFTPSANGATTMNIAVEKFTDPASNDNIAATEFNWTYYDLLTDPLLKKDVIALVESWNDIATQWGEINMDAMHDRLTWLERNKHTGKTSYQGIRVKFTNQQVDSIMNNSSNSSELDLDGIQSNAINSLVVNKNCLGDDGLLIDESTRDEISCSNQDYIDAKDVLKVSINSIESDLQEAAINKAVKLRESVIGSLNPSFKPIVDNWSVWTSGQISVGSKKVTSQASKQKVSNQTIHLGFDKPLENGKGVVGVALGVGLDKTDIGLSTSNVKAVSYSLTAYGEIYPNDNVSLEGVLGVGHLKFDTKRKDGASTFTGERDANQIYGSLRLKGSYTNSNDKDIDKKYWSFHPYAKLQMSHTKFDKFSEKGSGVTALTFEEQHLNNIRTSVGFDAHYQYRVDDKTFRPFAQIEIGKNLTKTSLAPLYYSIQGNSYTHNMNLNDRSESDVKIGLGLAIETNDNLTMALKYTRMESLSHDISLGDDYTETFNFKLDWKFASKSSSEAARQEALEVFNKKLTDEREAASASTAAYQDRMMEEEFSAFEAQLEAEFAAQEIMAEIKAEAATQEALEVFNKKLTDEREAASASTAAYQDRMMEEEFSAFEAQLEAEFAAQEIMAEIKAEAATQEALEVFNKKLIDERASSAKFTAAYQSKRANDLRIAALMNEITIQNEIALFELKLEAELAAQEMMTEIEAELNQ